MKIVTSEVMREIDNKTISGGFVEGLVLMGRAGRGAAEEIVKFSQLLDNDHVKRFIVICGKGNNGGDGYVIATALAELNYSVKLLSVCDVSELKGDALHHAQQLHSDVDFQRIEQKTAFNKGDFLIDCLLGTGLDRDLREPYASLVTKINASLCPVASIDIPSGLDGNSGKVHGSSVVADITLTVGLPKIGFFQNQGPEYTGRLKCIDIGFPQQVIDSFEHEGKLIIEQELGEFFPRRSHSTHKYRCGNVAVIGGSAKYGGAPMLAARAAARSGAGMVSMIYPQGMTVQGPDSLIKIPVASEDGLFCEGSVYQCLDSLGKVDTIVLGPGMTGDEDERAIVEKLFSLDKKIIADAGCLTHIASNGELLKRSVQTVLTPHSGELQRILSSLGLEDEFALAKKYNCHVVVKGQFSRVISPDGEFTYNSTGCNSLATAGSGDVLSGIIGALVSTFDDFQAAIEAAVAIHGLCGENVSSGIRGAIADDFIEELPQVLKKISCFN